jgi:Zn-dependent peptidase ImmA (M78 family)
MTIITKDRQWDQARDIARERARELIREHSIGNAPVPIESIATAHGIEILRHRFDGPESGFALRDNNRWYIGVNTQTSRRRQRFTIAHELGHLLLHEGRQIIVDQAVLRVDLRNDVSSMGTDIEEIQANTFAAALLMPEPIVASYAGDLIRSDGNIAREDLIIKLARIFDVSAEAMGYRLITLGILTS